MRRTSSGEELKHYAGECISSLTPGTHAAVITLSGELGAGKTTFTQGIAHTLGVEEVVTSPTFIIEKVYELANQKWLRFVHIDAYRLKSARELEVLGWKELVADPGNLIVLEWPERVAESIPEHAIRIRFDIENEGRIISIDAQEKS